MFINSILHSRSADYSTKSWLLFQNTEAIAMVACVSPKQLLGQSSLTTQKTCDKTYVDTEQRHVRRAIATRLESVRASFKRGQRYFHARQRYLQISFLVQVCSAGPSQR